MLGFSLVSSAMIELLVARVKYLEQALAARDCRIGELVDRLLVKEHVPITPVQQSVLDQDNIRKLVEQGSIFDEDPEEVKMAESNTNNVSEFVL